MKPTVTILVALLLVQEASFSVLKESAHGPVEGAVCSVSSSKTAPESITSLQDSYLAFSSAFGSIIEADKISLLQANHAEYKEKGGGSPFAGRWIEITKKLFPSEDIPIVSLEEYQEYERALTAACLEENLPRVLFNEVTEAPELFNQKVRLVTAYVFSRWGRHLPCTNAIATYFAAEWPLPIAGPACFQFIQDVIVSFHDAEESSGANHTATPLLDNLLNALVKEGKLTLSSNEFKESCRPSKALVEEFMLSKFRSLTDFNLVLDVLVRRNVPLKSWAKVFSQALHYYLICLKQRGKPVPNVMNEAASKSLAACLNNMAKEFQRRSNTLRDLSKVSISATELLWFPSDTENDESETSQAHNEVSRMLTGIQSLTQTAHEEQKLVTTLLSEEFNIPKGLQPFEIDRRRQNSIDGRYEVIEHNEDGVRILPDNVDSPTAKTGMVSGILRFLLHPFFPASDYANEEFETNSNANNARDRGYSESSRSHSFDSSRSHCPNGLTDSADLFAPGASMSFVPDTLSAAVDQLFALTSERKLFDAVSEEDLLRYRQSSSFSRHQKEFLNEAIRNFVPLDDDLSPETRKKVDLVLFYVAGKLSIYRTFLYPGYARIIQYFISRDTNFKFVAPKVVKFLRIVHSFGSEKVQCSHTKMVALSGFQLHFKDMRAINKKFVPSADEALCFFFAEVVKTSQQVDDLLAHFFAPSANFGIQSSSSFTHSAFERPLMLITATFYRVLLRAAATEYDSLSLFPNRWHMSQELLEVTRCLKSRLFDLFRAELLEIAADHKSCNIVQVRDDLISYFGRLLLDQCAQPRTAPHNPRSQSNCDNEISAGPFEGHETDSWSYSNFNGQALS